MKLTVTSTFNAGNLDPARFTERTVRVLREYDTVIFPAFKEEIKRAQFSWPGPTRRRNGSLVTSPRDIVDTGDFMRSQIRQPINSNATMLTYAWGGGRYGVNYAGYILAGVPVKRYPGRDWIRPALDRHPLDTFFAATWQRLAGTRRQSY
jgi:hypothetical protein